MPEAVPTNRGQGFGPRAVWAVQAFVLLFSLWLIFDGLSGWAVGLVAALAGGVLAGWLSEGPPFRWNPLRLAGFAGFFFVESFRGGVDVAWRTFHRRMPVAPRFFEYRVTLPAGQPRTLLISVISLLPGTLSAEFRPSRDILVVHTLAGGGHDDIARLEAWIAWLFSLPSAGKGAAP